LDELATETRIVLLKTANNKLLKKIGYLQQFLADRTNSHAYATVLRLSLSSVTLCIVAKWCDLEQKLLLTAYRKSYIRNQLVPK